MMAGRKSTTSKSKSKSTSTAAVAAAAAASTSWCDDLSRISDDIQQKKRSIKSRYEENGDNNSIDPIGLMERLSILEERMKHVQEDCDEIAWKRKTLVKEVVALTLANHEKLKELQQQQQQEDRNGSAGDDNETMQMVDILKQQHEQLQ